MKKRIVSALLAGFLLVSATACGKQPAADAAQPAADPTQAYLDTVNVDYAYDLALKLEDIRSNETLGYRTAGSDAELATGDMLKAEMERIGLQNVTKDAFTLDTQDSLFGLSRRCFLFLGYLRAKSRLAAVALRNTPAGVVPRTPFTRKGYAASVKRRSR